MIYIWFWAAFLTASAYSAYLGFKYSPYSLTSGHIWALGAYSVFWFITIPITIMVMPLIGCFYLARHIREKYFSKQFKDGFNNPILNWIFRI